LPYVELRVDKIVVGLTGVGLRIPLIRDLVFGNVLFHEVGHHIHRKIRPEYKEKEDVADTWATKLTNNFIRKAYWYLMPILMPLSKIWRFMRRKGWMRK
jgi:hypothetical protein